MVLVMLFKHLFNYLFELTLAAIAVATLAFVLADVLVHSIRELRDLPAALYYTFWELVCGLPHIFRELAYAPVGIWHDHVSDKYDQWRKRFERAFESQFEPEEPFNFRQKNDWTYEVDNSFVLRMLKKTSSFHALTTEGTATPSELCPRCASLDLSLKSFELLLNAHELQIQKETAHCGLCAMLYDHVAPLLTESMGDDIRLYRQGSNLLVAGVKEPVLTIRADVRSLEPAKRQDAPISRIQLGYPTVPKAGDPLYYELALEWLRQCDYQHKCARGSSHPLPTRVLDLGDPSADVSRANPPVIRLYQTSRGEKGRYITMSHCWGVVEPAQRARYCTYACNISDRMQGISLDDLPKSFCDAVTVTRRLGVRYLWIDSMCIVQPHHGCPTCRRLAGSDWVSECTRMEAYYSSAYCTIAATSARDSREGFLRHDTQEKEAEKFVEVPGPPGLRLYVCRFEDRFDRDVEGAVLNRRGWVLQERALSRRILHFTARQVYWECGKGVHSQTLTRMRSSAQRFMGDPQFPSALLSLVQGDRISVFQQLFALYSRLDLTEPTDRPLAISGLESRLARTLKTTAVHGVFVRYLHRSLLWCRAGKRPLQKIPFPPQRRVPTWSWMAHKGEIGYVQVPFSGMEWYSAVADSFHVNVEQPTEAGTDRGHQGRERVVFEVTVRRFAVSDEEAVECLQLDAGDYVYASATDTDRVRCVVLGRNTSAAEEGGLEYYHVLVVMQATSAKSQGHGLDVFERVGVGRLLRSHLSLSEPGLKARLV